MTLLSLFQGERGLLGSERLVFAPDEIDALHDSIAMSQRLEQRLAEESDRLAEACDKASERGYAAGRLEGLAASESRLVEQLESLQSEQLQAITLQREQCGAIALEIVRRLAGEVADADWLARLALRAAEELIEHAPLALHVHPARVEAVRRALDGCSHGIDSIIADDALQLDGCVLESRVGRVDASLETQLARLAGISLVDEPVTDGHADAEGRSNTAAPGDADHIAAADLQAADR